MSEFITPVVGQQYNLGGETVEVVQALKKRFWRIAVRPVAEDAISLPRIVSQADWAAKVAVGREHGA